MNNQHTARSVIGIVLASAVLVFASCSEKEKESTEQAGAPDDTKEVVAAADSDPANGDGAGTEQTETQPAETNAAGAEPDEDANPDPHPIEVDPPELDLGQVQLGQKGKGAVRLTNTSNEPIVFVNAKSSCGCTAVNAPRNKTMAPGESIEVEITMNIGVKQGVDLNKKVTWNFKDLPPIETPVHSVAHSFVAFEPATLNPKVDPEGKITLRSTDGTPFRITSVEPAIVGDISGETATEFVLNVNYATMEDLLADGLAIFTDHPKCERIAPPVEGIDWKLPAGVARSKDPSRRLLGWAKQGRVKGIEVELDAGADIETVDVRRLTPILVAVQFGHVDVVSALIDRGAKVDAANPQGQTALILAGVANHSELATKLLDAGASMESIDEKGRTALMQAAERGNDEIVRLLLERGASIEVRDRTQGTALTLACAFGNEATVRALLEGEADPSAADFLGYQALHWAAMKGDAARLSALLDAGAAINAPSSREQLSPLMCAARSGSLECLERLLAGTPDLEMIDKRGRTALLWAIRQGAPDKVSALLTAGASREVRDAEGDGPAEYAGRRANPEGDQIRELLEQAN